TERLFVFQVAAGTAQTAAGHGVFTGVDERDTPWFAVVLVNVHAVVAHVECDVGGMQEVVGEEVLDRVALVAQANHEIMDPVSGVLLHDVPENWLAADFNHRLGFEVRLLTDARAETTCQNYCLHRYPLALRAARPAGVGEPSDAHHLPAAIGHSRLGVKVLWRYTGDLQEVGQLRRTKKSPNTGCVRTFF